jgi:hypothetical protein
VRRKYLIIVQWNDRQAEAQLEVMPSSVDKERQNSRFASLTMAVTPGGTNI